MIEGDELGGGKDLEKTGGRVTSTSAQRQGALQSDPVEATFDTLFLAGLRHFGQRFEGTFPDRRLFKVLGQLLRGVMAASVPLIACSAAT